MSLEKSELDHVDLAGTWLVNISEPSRPVENTIRTHCT